MRNQTLNLIDWLNRKVDDVHAMMDDIAEQQELASEMSDALSSPVGFSHDADEVSVLLHY